MAKPAQKTSTTTSSPNVIRATLDYRMATASFVSFNPLAGDEVSSATLSQGWRVNYLVVRGDMRQAVIFGRMIRGEPVAGQSLVILLDKTNGPTIHRERAVIGSIVRSSDGKLTLTGDKTDHVFMAVETGLQPLRDIGRQGHLQKLLAASVKPVDHRSFGMQPGTKIAAEAGVGLESDREVLATVEKLGEVKFFRNLPGLKSPPSVVSLYDAPPDAGIRLRNLDDQFFRLFHEGEKTVLADAKGPAHRQDWLDDWRKFQAEGGKLKVLPSGVDLDDAVRAHNSGG